MSTIFPWFSENMADISKKLAEIKDAMQVKVKEEIAIQTSFKNMYILKKAKTSIKTLESVKYREQVASMREEISKLNEHLVTKIAGALMKRVVFRGEIGLREGCMYYHPQKINRGDPRSYFDVR